MGDLVSSDLRAETMATYLEKVQWEVKFVNVEVPPMPVLGEKLPVNEDSILQIEVKAALKHLKAKRAAGNDEVPPELWKALVSDDAAVLLLTELLNKVWEQKQIPDNWRLASVVSIFKKGDTSMPENYRPISLLVVGYKVLASILIDRLKRGGSEDRIRKSQYGFRAGRGTGDALFLARRMIDANQVPFTQPTLTTPTDPGSTP